MSHEKHDEQSADPHDGRSAETSEAAARRRLAQVTSRTVAMILQFGVLFVTFIAGLSLSGSQAVFWILALLQALIVLAVVIGRVFLWSSTKPRPSAALLVLLVPLASMALTVALILLAGLLSAPPT